MPKKCQTAELNFLHPSYFKMPNLTYLAFWNASLQPFWCIGGIQQLIIQCQSS